MVRGKISKYFSGLVLTRLPYLNRCAIKDGQILRTRNHDFHALVVLPPGLGGRIRDRLLRRWLSKGRLHYRAPTDEILLSVLPLIGHDVGAAGMAALRFWGQTGERSSVWMAAAEPVHLEARLDHLCLHALRVAQMPTADLRVIVDHLQATLGSEDYGSEDNGSEKYEFARIGHHAYLRGKHAIASAQVSAQFVDGQRPDDYMPKGGTGNGAERHDRLVSEIQMALHEHAVNIAREQAGQRVVNSLWIWGGGFAPEKSVQPILPLFSDDPLFKGFWLSRTGLAEPWSDGFDACLDFADRGFVAITPERQVDGEPELPDSYLRQLKKLLASKKIKRLSLLFRDGLRAEIKTADVYQFWRRESPLLKSP